MKFLTLITILVFASSCAINEVNTMPEECNSLKIPDGFTEWKDKPSRSQVKPPMPDKAVRNGVEGCAVLTFDFDKTGKPLNIKIEKEYPLRYNIGKMFAIYMLSNDFKKSANKTKQAGVFFLNIERKNP